MPRATAHLIGLAVGCALAAPAAAAAADPLPRPVVDRVICRSDCPGAGDARPGSTIRLRGRDLRGSDAVVFFGGKGPADNIEVLVRSARARRLDVKVPRTARSGRIAVVNADGVPSRPRPGSRLEIVPAPDGALLRSAQSPAVEVEMQGQRVYFDGARRATLAYVLQGPGAATVHIDLVRRSTGRVIRRWTRTGIPPGTPQTHRWNGRAAGKVQRNGSYEFRVLAEGPNGFRAQSAQAEGGSPGTPGPGEFTFLRHRFPILGAHDYGGFGAGFGGGRGHEGQDVFAPCGTPLVAARGGVVKHEAYHERAGHYIVIDGAATGTDYAYMHLREASPLEKGARVRTGQRIGRVGATGRAHGCHLHFEMWSAPGWYTGGSPFDPLPALLAWDPRA